MKKILILASAALLTFAACNKIDAPAELVVPDDAAAPVLTLDFKVSMPGQTRAVKSDWEDGDKVYVLFDSTIPSRDQYLTLTYTSGAWSGSWKGGLENDLAKKTSGTLSAFYVPFADETEISINPLDNSPSSITRGTAWFINPTNAGAAVKSYVFSCMDAAYSVSNNIVTATISLDVPAGYDFVHIFVPGLTSTNGRYTMKTEPALKGATPVAYKPGDGLIMEEADEFAGYAFGGSVCFSGYLPSVLAGMSADYKFKLYDNGGSPEDGADDNAFIYTVSGKSLSARSAIALPSTYSWKSIIYGEDATLRAIPMCELNGQTLYFANINLGATSLVDRPDCYGNKYFWAGTKPYPNDVYYNDLGVDGSYGDYGQPYYKADGPYYGNPHGYTKYVLNKSWAYNNDESYIDNKTVLDPEDDAATVTLGYPWRTPTVAECQSLLDNCQWTFDVPNNGWKVTGRGAYNGNVIFMPMTGRNDQGNGLNLNDEGVPGQGYYMAADGGLSLSYHPKYGGENRAYDGASRDQVLYNVRAVRTSPL